MTIASAVFLFAVGAILRYALTVEPDWINLDTVGLILMIAGGAGLVLSIGYELMRDREARPTGEPYDDRYRDPEGRPRDPEGPPRRPR